MPLFAKKPPQKSTRVFFATDLHGSERAFRKFVNAGKFYQADVLIMGGDILGKLVVPIVREAHGSYRANLPGRVERLEGEAELQRFQDRSGSLGFYSQVLSEDEYRAIAADRASVEALFQRLARERLERWIDLAEARLAGTGRRCFVTGGNDDYPDVLEALQRPGMQALLECEGQVVMLDDRHSMISLGVSTPTPWHTPREVSDEQLGQMIAELAARVPDLSRCVFNFHDPPNDSTLDTCPMLDWTSDPPAQIVRGGHVVLFGAGSRSVRRAIEQSQPLLSLHGHIHESPGVIRIGRTVCINPGSEYSEGILRGCLVTLSDGKVEGYQLTSG